MKAPFYYLIILTLLSTSNAHSEDNLWTTSTTVFSNLSSYQSSTSRDALFNAGIEVSSQYLDKGQWLLGFSGSLVSGLHHQPDTTEYALLIGGDYYYYPKALPGKLGFRLDSYLIQDEKTESVIKAGGSGKRSTITLSTDNIMVIQPLINYINYAKTFYSDISYALSSYDYGDTPGRNIEVQQLSPTIGVAMNDKFDWLQARLYFIDLSNSSRTHGIKSTQAFELKWTHWMGPSSLLSMDSIISTILLGERLLAVDADTHTVYSLSDEQTGALSFGSTWRLADHIKVSTFVDYNRYRNQTLGDEYTSLNIHLNLSKQW